MAFWFPYPNLGFAEDAPFMLKLREKTGRVGLMEDVEGLCLHIVHSTSSTPDPAISHHLSEEKLSSLAVSHSTAYDDFMENFWLNFSWITGIFTSLFRFWSCWSDLRTCRSDQLVSPLSDFTNFTMDFLINFTMSKTLKTVLWKWAKTPLHSSLDPGNGSHKAVVGWSVPRETLKDRSFVVKKNNEEDVVNKNIQVKDL